MRPLLMGVIRSATTDPVAAGMLRRILAEGPLLALARAIDRPDAALRASLAGSQLVGLMMARYVVGVEPLASAPRELVVRAIGPTIQRYLTGDLGVGGLGARVALDAEVRPTRQSVGRRDDPALPAPPRSVASNGGGK